MTSPSPDKNAEDFNPLLRKEGKWGGQKFKRHPSLIENLFRYYPFKSSTPGSHALRGSLCEPVLAHKAKSVLSVSGIQISGDFI